MRQNLKSLALGLLVFLAVTVSSCAPSSSALQTAIQGTMASWTQQPSQTPLPTYTPAPTRAIEVTRVVLVTPAVEGIPPQLLAPVADAAIPQNNPDIGCSLISGEEARGYGFQINFDWTDVPSAVRYHLVASHTGAALAAVDTVVYKSHYTETQCNGFVAGQNLEGWVWHVTAFDQDSNEGPRSDIGTFHFEPCRLADGSPCRAP